MQRDEFDNQIEISTKTSGSKWVREKSVLHGSAESLDFNVIILTGLKKPLKCFLFLHFFGSRITHTFPAGFIDEVLKRFCVWNDIFCTGVYLMATSAQYHRC